MLKPSGPLGWHLPLVEVILGVYVSISLPSPHWMLVHHRVMPEVCLLVPINLYTWAERGMVRVKCLGHPRIQRNDPSQGSNMDGSNVDGLIRSKVH